MAMNHEKMLTIYVILGIALGLTLGNNIASSYALSKHAAQSQVTTDPEIDKKVLKGVALILKGLNTILIGNTSGGLDDISIGANMIRASCKVTNGENGANGTSGRGANGGQGG